MNGNHGEDLSGDYDERMDFCKGMSMTMSMGGFQSSLFSHEPADCITFLLTGWKLDRSGKFVGAMSEFAIVEPANRIVLAIEA